MKIKEIQDLIDFINQSGLEEVEIETDELTLHIKRSKPVQNKEAALGDLRTDYTTDDRELDTTASLAVSKHPNRESTNKESTNTAYVAIKSPMIGTFYRATNPESAPFVKQGQSISKNQTVCVIEAMKLFNEIEAEVSGTIVEVLVEDASPVEYDQPLFLVKPN